MNADLEENISNYNKLKIAVFWVVAPCSLVTSTRLHGATIQKTAIFILTAVRTSNPTYNKLNGCIKRHFGTSMRKDIKQRLHNKVSKPALKYASETWTLRSQDKQ
jgi:hypothetical protein